MNVALFIIGTSHTLQCAAAGTDSSKVAAFEAELHRACAEHRIARVAEEMSEAGLGHQQVEHTVGYQVAKALGIEHQHVDLEPEERIALSLDDGTMLKVVCGGGLLHLRIHVLQGTNNKIFQGQRRATLRQQPRPVLR